MQNAACVVIVGRKVTRAQFTADGGSMQHQIIREANRINRLTKNRRYAQIEALKALRQIYEQHKDSESSATVR